MMLFGLLFPASLLLVLGSAAFCGFRYGRGSLDFRMCLLLLAYLLLSYIASFIAVCLNPFWIDNGVEEFIPWSERWSWAVLGAGLFEIILSPLLAAGCFMLRSRCNRGLMVERKLNRETMP